MTEYHHREALRQLFCLELFLSRLRNHLGPYAHRGNPPRFHPIILTLTSIAATDAARNNQNIIEKHYVPRELKLTC